MGMGGLKIVVMAVIGVAALNAHAAEPAAAPVPTPPGDLRATLVPVVTEYQWVFHVPVGSLEHQRVAVTAPVALLQSRRWIFEMPEFRARHVKLWDIPEFSCKYPDLILPNTCRTVWHGVYADVPALVNAHQHVDVEVPRVRMEDILIDVYIPRWTWKDKTFRFSLPAIAPQESVERARWSLTAQRTEVNAAVDETIASLDRQIEALRTMGEDPAKLESGDGTAIDLLAQRQTLLDERAQELERLAAIDAELSALAAR
jgi:hypothetical protein